jgi:hypothetical protein
MLYAMYAIYTLGLLDDYKITLLFHSKTRQSAFYNDNKLALAKV